jgi:hypothetical protein
MQLTGGYKHTTVPITLGRGGYKHTTVPITLGRGGYKHTTVPITLGRGLFQLCIVYNHVYHYKQLA